MEAGTHVFSHSGPTNTKLRVHLGLDIPESSADLAAAALSRLRVCNEYLLWKQGKIAIFDTNKPGRIPDGVQPALINGSTVLDFAFDPFDNNRKWLMAS